MKCQINFNREEIKTIYSKPSANFAAIKNYKGLNFSYEGVALNLFFLTYVTPYFNQQMDWGWSIYEEDEKSFREARYTYLGDGTDWRELAVLNGQKHWFGVNGDSFPRKSKYFLDMKYAPYGILADSFWGCSTMEYLMLDKFFFGLYFLRARDVDLVRAQFLDKFVLRCKQVGYQAKGQALNESNYKIRTKLQKEVYEGKINFVSAIEPVHKYGFFLMNRVKNLDILYANLQKLEFEAVEFNVSLANYKEFLLSRYHQKSGQLPISNFTEELLEDVETVDELLMLDYEIFRALNNPLSRQNFFHSVDAQNPGKEFQLYLKMFWPRMLKHAFRKYPAHKNYYKY